MREYTLTTRAEADLFDIAVYGYRPFGIRPAEAYAGGLEHVFRLLAANPRMGRNADAIRPGVHRHEYAAHVILYEPVEGGVLILAIVHAAASGGSTCREGFRCADSALRACLTRDPGFPKGIALWRVLRAEP